MFLIIRKFCLEPSSEHNCLVGSLCVRVAEIREEEFFVVNPNRSLSSGKGK